MITVEQALVHWQKKKLITADKAIELKRDLPKDGESDHTSKAITIFSAVGAILIGLGVILFIASNWVGMSPVTKLMLLILGTIGTGVGGYIMMHEPGEYPKTGIGLLFVNIFIYGASIFLVGQIFHLPIHFALGSFLWLLGTAYFAYAMTSKMHLWFSVPLMLLTIGWTWSNGSATGSEFDFISDSRNSIYSLLPLIGLGLLAASTLHERVKHLRFGARTLLHWGMFLILFSLVIATIERTVFYAYFTPPIDTFVLFTMVVVFVLLIASLFMGKFTSERGKTGLIAMFVFLAFVSALSLVPRFFGLDLTDSYLSYEAIHTPMFTALYTVYILLVFAALFLAVWFGTLLRSTIFVNLGMIGLAFAIIIQYFSWAFAQFDRSIAFILGGILILGVSFVLERQRRKIVSSFDHT